MSWIGAHKNDCEVHDAFFCAMHHAFESRHSCDWLHNDLDARISLEQHASHNLFFRIIQAGVCSLEQQLLPSFGCGIHLI